LLVFLSILPACSDSDEATVEEAKYALDSQDWDKSIELAMSVLDSDPSNVRAALVASSAYAGRGGFRVLDLAVPLSQDIKRRLVAFHMAIYGEEAGQYSHSKTVWRIATALSWEWAGRRSP
jgi:hypothetical protein